MLAWWEALHTEPALSPWGLAWAPRAGALKDRGTGAGMQQRLTETMPPGNLHPPVAPKHLARHKDTAQTHLGRYQAPRGSPQELTLGGEPRG